jgi:hypothetical protein
VSWFDIDPWLANERNQFFAAIFIRPDPKTPMMFMPKFAEILLVWIVWDLCRLDKNIGGRLDPVCPEF